MNKRALCIALVALVGGAWAQDLEQRVSYTGPATTAKQLLQTLGTQTGILLGTTPQTANEVLVVKVDNVKLMDLLKHIASACAAEWKQESGGYRLVRPEALAREQSRADVAARAKAFEAPLRRLVEGVNKVPALDEAQARRMADEARKLQESAAQGGGQLRFNSTTGGSSARSPAARALVRLLDALSPTTLAGIAPNTRVVFASSPNRMQRALGAKANTILSSFVQEHNAYARALADTPRETAPPNTRIMILGGPDLSALPLERIGKALVVFTRGADKALSVELKVADASGAIVARANEFLTPDAAPAPEGTNDAGKPIVLSQQAREYATLMAGPAAAAQTDGQRVVRISVSGGANMMWSSGATPVPAVSDEWKQRLAQPEKLEPHEFVAGPVLRDASGESGNLVANLHDDALIPVCRRLLNARMTPTQFLGFLSTEMDLEIKREEGWLLIAPRHPSEVRDAQVDRAPLGGLLRLALKNGHARLDEMASYALRQPDGLSVGAFDERTIRLLSPDTGQDFEFNGSDRRSMLKLYGLMGASQRAQLAQGGSIRLGALDGRQAAHLQNMVFNSPSGPSISQPDEGNQGPQPQGQVQQQVIAIAQAPGGGRGQMPAFARSFDTHLIQERTEALPFGVPGDGVLTLRVDRREGVLGTRADGSDARFMSADQLAGDLIASGNPELAAITGGGSGPYAKFRPATLTQFDFQFQFSQIAQMGRQLRDAEIAAGTTTTGFQGLPQTFQTQVQQTQRRMEEMSSRIRFDGPLPARRGGQPPPL